MFLFIVGNGRRASKSLEWSEYAAERGSSIFDSLHFLWGKPSFKSLSWKLFDIELLMSLLKTLGSVNKLSYRAFDQKKKKKEEKKEVLFGFWVCGNFIVG